MKNFKTAFLASVVVASASGVATAADGTLGTSSTADSIVTVVKDNAVRITGVDNVTFDDGALLAADDTKSDSVCVYSSTGTYTVTATSANGTAGGFAMEIDSATLTDTLDYSVSWNDADSDTGAQALTSGGTLVTQAGSTDVATNFNCNGGNNARFLVTVASVDYNAAPIGTYLDTLTFLVAPE